MFQPKLLLGFSLLCIPFIPGCDSPPERHQTVYVALESNTSEEKLFSQDVLYEMSENFSGRSQIVIDELKGKSTVNVFSDKASSHALREAIDVVEITLSDDEALVSAIHRAALLGQDNKPVFAVLVTSGTIDKQSIAKIRAATKDIKENTFLYVIGVTEENRLPMSNAFSEVRGNVKLGSSETEMLSVASKLKGK